MISFIKTIFKKKNKFTKPYRGSYPEWAQGFSKDPSYYYDWVQLEFSLPPIDNGINTSDTIASQEKQIISGSGKLDFANIEKIDPNLVNLTNKSNEGNIKSQYKLGIYYSTKENYEKESFKWLLRSAIQGDSKAAFLVAQNYTQGKGCEVDLNQALEWFIKAAEKDHAEAQYFVAQAYYYGETGEVNYQEAIKWLRQSSDNNFPAAQNFLANFLLEEDLFYADTSLPIEVSAPVSLFKRAALQENADAQYNLGLIYSGNTKGHEDFKDLKQMIYWYKESAKQGVPMAQNNLGISYASGIGVEIDMSKAKYWIGKAKEDDKTRELAEENWATFELWKY